MNLLALPSMRHIIQVYVCCRRMQSSSTFYSRVLLYKKTCSINIQCLLAMLGDGGPVTSESIRPNTWSAKEIMKAHYTFHTWSIRHNPLKMFSK